MNAGVLRAGVLATLMVLAPFAAQYLRPPELPASTTRDGIETEIPASFGDWSVDRSVVPVTMSADVENALYDVYDAVLGRTYVNSQGERIMLSVGYTRQQGGKQKPHWQEICYRAQGFNISALKRQQQRVAGREIPVTRLVATQNARVEPVTYWLTLGDHVVKDRWDRLERLLLLGLTRETADGYLVRISSLSDAPDAAFAAHLRFAEDLAAVLPTDRVHRLFGLP